MKIIVKNRGNHINHLTPEIMDRYLRGDLTDREMNAVERLMLESEFDKEAMEGISSLSEGQMVSDLSLLQKRLDNRVIPSRKNTWWLVAAIFALLVTSGVLLVEYTNPSSPQISESQSPPIDNQEFPEKEENVDVEETIEEDIADADDQTELMSEAPPQEQISAASARSEKLAVIDEEMTILDSDEAVVSSPEQLSGLAADSLSDLSLPQIAINRREQQLYGTIKGEDLGPRTMSAGKRLDLLHGKVVNQSGTPIPGANIEVTGTDKGTVTNDAGEFELNVGDVPGNKLKISYLGLLSQELQVPTQDSLTVVMSDDTMSLDEVANMVSSKSATPSNGLISFNEYLKANVNKPEIDSKEGEVVVEFTVKANGDLEDFKILKTPGEPFSAEALRLIKEGPIWNPALQNGTPSDDRVQVVVTFPSDN